MHATRRPCTWRSPDLPAGRVGPRSRGVEPNRRAARHEEPESGHCSVRSRPDRARDGNSRPETGIDCRSDALMPWLSLGWQLAPVSRGCAWASPRPYRSACLTEEQRHALYPLPGAHRDARALFHVKPRRRASTNSGHCAGRFAMSQLREQSAKVALAGVPCMWLAVGLGGLALRLLRACLAHLCEAGPLVFFGGSGLIDRISHRLDPQRPAAPGLQRPVSDFACGAPGQVLASSADLSRRRSPGAQPSAWGRTRSPAHPHCWSPTP